MFVATYFLIALTLFVGQWMIHRRKHPVLSHADVYAAGVAGAIAVFWPIIFLDVTLRVLFRPKGN